jgi:hypothetical protein
MDLLWDWIHLRHPRGVDRSKALELELIAAFFTQTETEALAFKEADGGSLAASGGSIDAHGWP